MTSTAAAELDLCVWFANKHPCNPFCCNAVNAAACLIVACYGRSCMLDVYKHFVSLFFHQSHILSENGNHSFTKHIFFIIIVILLVFSLHLKSCDQQDLVWSLSKQGCISLCNKSTLNTAKTHNLKYLWSCI